MFKNKHLHIATMLFVLTLAAATFSTQVHKTFAGNGPEILGNNGPGDTVSDLSNVYTYTLETDQSGSEQVTPSVSFIADDGYAYIATSDNPAQIERRNLGSNGFTHDNTLTLGNLDGRIIAGFADGNYGYFFTDANPGKIFKVVLSTMTIDSTVVLDSQYGEIKSATSVPGSDQMIFSSRNSNTSTTYGFQEQIDHDNSTSNFTNMLVPSGNDLTGFQNSTQESPTSAVAYDQNTQHLYIGMDDQSILMLDFSHTFSPSDVSFANVDNGSQQIFGNMKYAFSDSSNNKVYFVTGGGTPGQLVQIDANSNLDNSTATAIQLTNASNLNSFAYDSTEQVAFVASDKNDNTSYLSEVDLGTFQELNTLNLAGLYEHNNTMFADPTKSILYVGSTNNTDPAVIQKVSYSHNRAGSLHGYLAHRDSSFGIDHFSFYSHYDGSKGDKHVAIALYDGNENLIWNSNQITINLANSYEQTSNPIDVQLTDGTTQQGYDLTDLGSGDYYFVFATDVAKQSIGVVTSNPNPSAFDYTPNGYNFGDFPSSLSGANFNTNEEWALYATLTNNNNGGGGTDLSGPEGNFLASDLLGQTLETEGTLNWTGTEHNNGSKDPNAEGMSFPTGSYVDTINHRLFVTDAFNGRVIVYNLDESGNLEDHIADFVIGQTDLVSNDGGGTQQSQFSPLTDNGGGPFGLTYDSTRNLLFVSDSFNNRILVFDASPSTLISNNTQQIAESASYVIGQPLYSTVSSGTTNHNLSLPVGMAMDEANHRLFVSDAYNYRVLVFDVSTTNLEDCATGVELDSAPTNNKCSATPDNSNYLVSLKADYVIGQSGMGTNSQGTSNSGLSGAYNIAYDGSKYLYVADGVNNRVLVFDVTPNTMTNGKSASYVIGQSGYGPSHVDINSSSGSTPNDHGFLKASSVAVDQSHNILYVGDSPLGDLGSGDNGRIMLFNIATSGTTNADHLQTGEHAFQVIGKPDFVSTGMNATRSSLVSAIGISVDPVKNRLYAPDLMINRVLIFDFVKTDLSLPTQMTVGDDFTSDTPTLSNNQGTISYVVSAGSLPTGLSLDADTGVVSGSPTTAGDYSFTIRTKDTIDGGYYFYDNAYTTTVAAAENGGGGGGDNNNVGLYNSNPLDGGFSPAFLLNSNPTTGSSGSNMHGSATAPSCDASTRAGKDAPFTDLANGQTRTYVTALYQQCAVDGKDSTTFDPNANVTRAEAVKIIILISKLNLSNFHSFFRDVAANSWFAQFVTTAVDNNIIKGFADDSGLAPSFRPNDTITRAEALKVLLLAKGVQVPEATTNSFADVEPSDWYYNIVNYALTQKYVSGYSTDAGLMFKPNAPVTRADLAKMAYTVFGLNQG